MSKLAKTSRAAETAARVPTQKLRASQARVLAMFKLYGDCNDKQLLEYLHAAEYDAGMTRLMSPSGCRSRRSELSKPNMERLADIAAEMVGFQSSGSYDLVLDAAEQHTPGIIEKAREQLRREGFRSPLWDTGKTEVVDGRRVVVWGLAR